VTAWRRVTSIILLVLTAGIAFADGEFGTIVAIGENRNITFQPWGKTSTETRTVSAAGNLKPGMWIKFTGNRVLTGQFVAVDGDRIVIFKDLPEEFLTVYVPDWYTNEAGGVKFKVQLMRGPDNTVTGDNVRPANYREPTGGFVFYLPPKLKGAVLNHGGPKPGSMIPDADGKVLINKDTVTEKYWKHLRNPQRPEAGFVSGLTELTIRKLPPRAQ